MYERMLDKQHKLTFSELEEYCARTSELFVRLHNWISINLSKEKKIVFPYGNSYGWGVTHRKKTKLICNIFAEDDAFCVMVRLSNKQFAAIYKDVSAYAKNYIDNKYLCNDGGWIHFRVLNEDHYEDIKKILMQK